MTQWSLRQLLLFCLGWLVGAPLLALASILVREWLTLRALARDRMPASSYNGSLGLPGAWPLAAVLLLPPIVVLAVWLYGRLRRR